MIIALQAARRQQLVVDELVQPVCYLALGDGADHLVRYLPVFEKEESGDGHYIVFAGQLALGIRIDFEDLGFAGELLGDGVHMWRDHPARPAPYGPEVY